MFYKIFSDGVNLGTKIINFSTLRTKVWYTKSKTPVTNPIQKNVVFRCKLPIQNIVWSMEVDFNYFSGVKQKKSDFLTNLG